MNGSATPYDLGDNPSRHQPRHGITEPREGNAERLATCSLCAATVELDSDGMGRLIEVIPGTNTLHFCQS